MARRSFCRDLRPLAQPVTPLPKSHLTHPTTLTPPDPPEPRCAAVFFKRRHRIPSWGTLSACCVETHLDAWWRSNRKQPNKPNLAKPQWNQGLLRVKNDSEGRSGGITFQLRRGCSASAPRRCDRVRGSVPDSSIVPWQARLHLVPAGVSQAAGVPRRTPADGRKKVQTAMLECRSCSLMRL